MKKILMTLAIILGLMVTAFQDKPKFDLKASMAKGQTIYTTYCTSCHMENGEGIEDVYPPLAKSDYLMADKVRMIKQILFGATGNMKVNGKTYNGEMTGFNLTDEEMSNLANYIRNSFGNKGTAVTPENVKGARK